MIWQKNPKNAPLALGHWGIGALPKVGKLAETSKIKVSGWTMYRVWEAPCSKLRDIPEELFFRQDTPPQKNIQNAKISVLAETSQKVLSSQIIPRPKNFHHRSSQDQRLSSKSSSMLSSLLVLEPLRRDTLFMPKPLFSDVSHFGLWSLSHAIHSKCFFVGHHPPPRNQPPRTNNFLTFCHC